MSNMTDIQRSLGINGGGVRVGEWTLAPLTQRVKAEMTAWLEDYARAKLETRKDSLAPEVYRTKEKELEIRIDSGVYAWGGVAMNDAVGGIGIFQLIRCLLKYAHPAISFEEVEKLVEKNPKLWAEAVVKAIKMGSPDPKATGEESGPTTAASNGRRSKSSSPKSRSTSRSNAPS